MVGKFERDEEPKKKKKDAVDGGAAAEVRKWKKKAGARRADDSPETQTLRLSESSRVSMGKFTKLNVG